MYPLKALQDRHQHELHEWSRKKADELAKLTQKHAAEIEALLHHTPQTALLTPQSLRSKDTFNNCDRMPPPPKTPSRRAPHDYNSSTDTVDDIDFGTKRGRSRSFSPGSEESDFDPREGLPSTSQQTPGRYWNSRKRTKSTASASTSTKANTRASRSTSRASTLGNFEGRLGFDSPTKNANGKANKSAGPGQSFKPKAVPKPKTSKKGSATATSTSTPTTPHKQILKTPATPRAPKTHRFVACDPTPIVFDTSAPSSPQTRTKPLAFSDVLRGANRPQRTARAESEMKTKAVLEEAARFRKMSDKQWVREIEGFGGEEGGGEEGDEGDGDVDMDGVQV